MHARPALPSLSLVIAALAAAPLAASVAAAQDASCQVALSELTVNDEPPPDQYRDLLATAIRPTIEPILQCYRDRTVQRPGIQGNLRLRLWVSARQVIRATPEESTLGDPQLEQCAIARIREFRLPDSAPDGGARVRFVLRFWQTGVPATAPGTAGATATPGTAGAPGATSTAGAAGATSTTGSAGATGGATQGQVIPPFMAALPPGTAPAQLGRARIHVDAIRGAIAADALTAAIPQTTFDQCPAGAGDLRVRMTIARDGSIRARQAGGTIRDRALVRCIVDRLRARTTPAATANTRATITVTLTR